MERSRITALHSGAQLGQGLFAQVGLLSVYPHYPRKYKLNNFIFHMLIDISI